MRLIDADALLSQYSEMIYMSYSDYAAGVRDAISDIENAPTIRGCINKAALQVQIFLAWNEACISGQQEFADGLERALDIIDSAPVIGNGEVKHGEDTVD